MTTQTQNQTRAPFLFTAGTGTLRCKRATEADIISGAVALPKDGQCFVDGNYVRDAKLMKLTVKRQSDRQIVATLTLPVARDVPQPGQTREGKLVCSDKRTFKVIATFRVGEHGPYLALRLPDVKAQYAGF